MIAMRCVVMFTDVHDFSKVAVTLGEELGGFIQEMYQILGERIVRAHGSIIKYMGDAILAVFPDKAEQAAVECAFRMRGDYADLVQRWGIAADTELEVGIGSGKVVRGMFGHSSLRADDVFGEEVCNVAVIGHHRGVAVTRGAWERVRDTYAAEKLPDTPVKWRPEPLESWAVAETPNRKV